VKAPSGGVLALGTTSAAAAVTSGPPSSSSSAWEPLIWLFDGAAYAAMVARGWVKIRMGSTLFIGGNPTNSWPRRTLVDLFQKS
jgi:hypothetical protein